MEQSPENQKGRSRRLLRWRKSQTASIETTSETEQQPKEKPGRGIRKKLVGIKGKLFSRDSPWLVYLGIFVMVAGFSIVTYTWGKVAGLLAVPLQLPYIISGGLVGLGLVMLGVGITNIAVKRRNAFARERKLQKLTATMESILKIVEERGAQAEEGVSQW